jgi:hypothetical protein
MTMKNEIQSLTIPKIKRMMRLRLASMLFSVLFIGVVIIFSLGKQVMHWPWAGSIPVAAACAALAGASCIGYLILNKRLASGGL